MLLRYRATHRWTSWAVLETGRRSLYAQRLYKGFLMHTNNNIRSDLWLKRMAWLGIPLALVCVLSLWAGQWLGSGGLGRVFILTLPPVLVIGFAYNIRYLLLVQRARRASSRS
ncbi:hypothetical protein CLV44_11082 [Marinobacterium halophilum]|uniref:Uncharacterized protein n=2 Tax=Marinobacterium halophilum TaxID=267374 RepID=A0A2P8EWQ2_9GAMM|nr:hypothetical protein CLV44_11082 [Marinobacterium halophilum]